MVAFHHLTSVLLGALAAVRAVPLSDLVTRQSVSTLTPSQVASFTPYTWYASTAYCEPASTLSWNCGGSFLQLLMPAWTEL